MSFFMAGLSVAWALLLSAIYVSRRPLARKEWRRIVSDLAYCWTVAAIVSLVPLQTAAAEWLRTPVETAAPTGSVAEPGSLQPVAPVDSSPQPAPQVASTFPGRNAPTSAAVTPVGWRATRWLPAIVDDGLHNLSSWRDTFRRTYVGGGTNIDDDVGLQSGAAVVAYVPRALLIGLFAPFPNQWVEEGRKVGGTTMRLVTAVEMMILYVALAMVPPALWRWRKRIEIYLIASWALVPIVAFSMVLTNVGALYRFRYGFLTTMGALGIAYISSRDGGWISAWRRGRHRSFSAG